MKQYGLMIDVSRGKVYSIEQIKKIMDYCQKFGYTYINLYIEDLITLENYPQYGYMRGRYSDVEIKQLVNYSHEIGIELYPAIQTLGHLEHFLKWADSAELADTSKVLNVNNERSLVFIEQLVAKCKQLFEVDKINIGMDEAFDLGMGSVFRQLGTINQKQLYLQHLDNVVAICKKHDYKTIKIWSDMMFSVYSNKGEEELYSTVTADNLTQLDDCVELVFWNYWSQAKSQYVDTITAHKQFSDNISVALGVHTWLQPTYLSKQLTITKQGVAACQEQQIDDILFTMWGDDGSLYNLDTAIYGIYLTSCVFKNEQPSDTEFEQITALPFASLEHFCKITDIGLNPLAVFWNDPITNIYLNSFSNSKLRTCMKLCEKQLTANDDYICRLNNLYIAIVSAELELYLDDVYNLSIIEDYEKLLIEIENQWIQQAKYHGLEDVQKRLATKIYRLKFLFKNKENSQVNQIRKDKSYIEYEVKDNYSSVSSAINTRW